ncbi:MAG: histidine kinase [Raineya sp.]|jgi:sensor histidine kinase YesM|nr:histidine kinase [Raineya sp.]
MAKVFTFLGEWIFLTIIKFALGAISYFSLQEFGVKFGTVGDTINSNAFNYIFLGNITQAGTALVILKIYLRYHHYIYNKFFRYIILAILLYFSESLIDHVILSSSGSFNLTNFIKDLFHIHILELVFGSHIIIATLFLYAYSQKERIRSEKMVKQDYEMAVLQELKTKAELEALQAKINPHFLYNALNSVASLIHDNPDKAEKMVLLLAKFFRYSTNAKSQYYSSLSDELEMVKTYLEVEKVRFEDRLSYEIQVENPQLLYLQIPQFLIQPIVENAIKHSISKISTQGKIRILIQEENKQLLIEIADNGVPFPENFQVGYGLRSTQEKLRLLGGKDARMEIENGDFKKIKLFLNINLDNK